MIEVDVTDVLNRLTSDFWMVIYFAVLGLVVAVLLVEQTDVD